MCWVSSLKLFFSDRTRSLINQKYRKHFKLFYIDFFYSVIQKMFDIIIKIVIKLLLQ